MRTETTRIQLASGPRPGVAGNLIVAAEGWPEHALTHGGKHLVFVDTGGRKTSDMRRDAAEEMALELGDGLYVAGGAGKGEVEIVQLERGGLPGPGAFENVGEEARRVDLETWPCSLGLSERPCYLVPRKWHGASMPKRRRQDNKPNEPMNCP